MALSSVVQAYSAQQVTDVPNGGIGLQAFPSFQTVNIPQTNQMNLVNSSETSTSLILPSVTPPHPPYFQSASLPNAYFATASSGPDPFRFIQPTLHALVNPYPSFRSSPYSTSVTNGAAARACLLPTPNPMRQASSAEALAQNEGGGSGRHVVTGEAQCESRAMSEDQMSVKQQTASSENAFQHQNTIILIVRLLMSGKEVGSIIGKRGENVKKYREESGARINISDGSSPERIVTVTGTTDQIFVAFSLMSQKFEDDFTQGLLRMGDEGLTCPPVTLRLLVPATQCGSIIGKGGSRIKDVREITGASIQVASEALPTSTERTVTISGTAKAIAKCIRQLCDIFIESPAKGPVIPYRPKPAFVNQPVMCPTGPFPAGVIPPMGFPGMTGENNPDHTYGTCTPTPGVVLSSPVPINTEPSTPVPTSIGQPVLGAIGMPHAKFLAMDGNLNTVFSTSNDSNTSACAIASNRPTLVDEILADPTQLSNALSFSDFPSNPVSLLSVLHSNHLAANALQNPILNPIASSFALPELAMNPRLLGFYNSQPFSLMHQNGTEPNDESSEARQTNGTLLSDVYTNNPVYPLIHPNAYLQSAGMLSPVSTSPVPMMQNKSSILGLPAFPLQSMLVNSANGVTEDANVIKEIVLSNDLIGCIIGRGGTTVNEIRNISKAQVKISNCEDGAKNRKITLSGSPNAVNLAHFLINNSIAAHQQMWSYNVQLASAATLLMSRCNSTEPSGIAENNSTSFNGQTLDEDKALQTTEDSQKHNCQPRNNCTHTQNEQPTLVDILGSVLDTDLVSSRAQPQKLQTKVLSHKSIELRQQSRFKIAPY